MGTQQGWCSLTSFLPPPTPHPPFPGPVDKDRSDLAASCFPPISSAVTGHTHALTLLLPYHAHDIQKPSLVLCSAS